MVTFSPRTAFLVMGVATALALAPLSGRPCGPCGPIDGSMDCCDHAPGPTGAPEGCPGDELDSAEWAPVAADLSAPAPVRDLAKGSAGAPPASLLPGSREDSPASLPLRPTPELYLLHAVFLI